MGSRKKTYDTFKNKICETKAWGDSQEAKEMQVSAAFKKWLIHGVLKVVYSSDILSLIFK